ncbi:MAG: ribonucleoside-diphosphate reductase, adenosylcobalamin-dependent, partial [Bacteroidota bacterium]
VNVPNDISEEMVAKIYETGWEAGCKGMTIYRDGSRSGVLVSTDEKNKQSELAFEETHAPKRPDKLEAEVVRFNNENEQWVAVVGLMEGRPYEVFTGPVRESFSVLKKVNDGWVIKSKDESGGTRYDFQYLDNDGYRITIEGLSRTFDQEYWNYAKLISGVLRHGMPLQHVVHMVGNLRLDAASLNTWKNGVVRTLKKFIPDGTVPVDKICSECGDSNLVYQEGCLTCMSCGHSKCE